MATEAENWSKEYRTTKARIKELERDRPSFSINNRAVADIDDAGNLRIKGTTLNARAAGEFAIWVATIYGPAGAAEVGKRRIQLLAEQPKQRKNPPSVVAAISEDDEEEDEDIEF